MCVVTFFTPPLPSSSSFLLKQFSLFSIMHRQRRSSSLFFHPGARFTVTILRPSPPRVSANLGDCMSFPQHHPVVHVPAPDSAIRQGPPTPPLAREVMQPTLTLIYAFIYLKSLLATVCHLPLHLSGAFGYDVGATARCGKGASIIANGRTGSFLVLFLFCCSCLIVVVAVQRGQ